MMLRFQLPDLTPNPGLWWYFFTEMFDHFRPFFLMVFSVFHAVSTELAIQWPVIPAPGAADRAAPGEREVQVLPLME